MIELLKNFYLKFNGAASNNTAPANSNHKILKILCSKLIVLRSIIRGNTVSNYGKLKLSVSNNLWLIINT